MAKKSKPTTKENYVIPKRPVGRTEMYTIAVEPFLQNIHDWLRDGATEEEVAKRLGLGSSTFKKYKRNNPELKRICILARQDFDYRVVDTLKKRALGMTVTESKRKLVTPELTEADLQRITDEGLDPVKVLKDKQILIETTLHERHLAPDINAIRLYMQHSQMLGSLDEELKSVQIEKLTAEVKQIRAEMANESEVAVDWADKAREVAAKRKQKKLAEQATEELQGLDWS